MLIWRLEKTQVSALGIEYVPDQLPLRRAQHPHIVQHHRIHFANPLVGVEEHNEEHHRDAQDATFDQIPSPNHSRKIGASTTRGNALSNLM